MYYTVFALFIVLWIAGYQLIKGLMSRNNYVDRIGIYTGQVEINKEEKHKKREAYRHGLSILAKSIEKSGILENYKNTLRKKLTKANILMRPEEFLSICLILSIFFGFLGILIFGRSILILFFGFMGWLFPSIILKRKIGKRSKIINNQLGDTIAILSNAMKAGHSFFQSIDSVTREMTGPVSDEFMKLQKEISLGVNTDIALENMVNRVGSDDLELMVTAVLIQRQIGGNLAEILDNISGTIRERIRAKGEIKTLTAQGRMSGIIISLLPLALALMITMMNPQQMLKMITEPLGILMIIIAIVMEVIGIVFIRKIIAIEV